MIDKTLFHNIEDAFIKIGYKRNLIKADYQYADLFSQGVPIRTVGHAIFGQEPLDYRSACFGIQAAKPNISSDAVVHELRALGAPQIFIINNSMCERWAITEKDPLRKEKYKTAHLPAVIEQNINDWNPKAIIRVKSGFSKPGPRQMDFVDIGLIPALEHEAAKKIDSLLGGLLHHAEKEFKKHGDSFDASIIFRIVFSLLAAKLLKDRAVVNSSAINFSDPQSALDAVSSHYGASLNVMTSIPASTLYSISQEIGQSFSLKNISVDTLTYVYENTFVSPESRKSLGIHSTPSYIADYVLSQIPIEDLPKTQWHTLDPMCGHGIFLIAAMRRIRDLLPKDWGGQRRHKFFVEHLHGIELDSFSVEVARLCLMLADFPEPNGWDLKRQDVFSGKVLENSARNTMILVGNPPFENIEDKSPVIPKPVELLKRTLSKLPNGAFVGLILPRSFSDSSRYKNERASFLRDFEIVSLTSLPEHIFLYSAAETSIIVARKQRPTNQSITTYKEVKDSHRDIFRVRYGYTWEDKIPQSYFANKMNNRLVVPLLRELWEELETCPRLCSVVDIRKGVEFETGAIKNDGAISQKPRPGLKPGLAKVTDGFMQFVADDMVYISTEEKFKRVMTRAAWDLPWDKPKIIVPTSRMSGGIWRFAAAIDVKGLIATRRFYAIWPKKDEISIEVVAAILNSPIAAAYTYAHSFGRDIPARVYEQIPLPKYLPAKNSLIELLVRKFIENLPSDKNKAKELLLQIDAEILKLYQLPPRLEHQLLNIFREQQRHVPFEFKYFISPDVDSWIPFHVYISKQLNTPDKIMERIPVIHDAELIKYLKKLGREK